VARLKAQYRFTPFLPVTVLLMELGDFPMMRMMLLGIRSRAEAAAGAHHRRASDGGSAGP
jgi:hypothetical protein